MSSVPEPGNLEFVDSTSLPETEAFEPVELPTELLVRNEDAPRLVFDPAIERVYGQGVHAFRVSGRLAENVVPWGFWGATLIAVVLGMVVVFRGATGLYSLWDTFWVVLALLVGTVMFKLGRRSSLSKELLCELDLNQQLMLWPREGETQLAVPFEELTELVFGMTYYPVSQKRKDVMVHAFTLLARDSQNRLIPIVEASPDKEKTHEIGVFLGRNMRLPLKYVGLGIK